MRTYAGIRTVLILATLTISTVLALLPVTAARSSLSINSFQVKPMAGSGDGQRLLNVTVDIGNAGAVAENFTIKLYWDGSPVANLNVTNFAPGARQSFTLAQSVTFDPTTGHYVGVSAGDAWSAIPVYRPPGYGIGSSNLQWWNNNAYLVFVGLVVAIVLAITLAVFIVLRRSGNSDQTDRLEPKPAQLSLV
jgi:hypothetical protein